MTECDEIAFFEFQATEKNASPRTLGNYRDALAAYRTWRGEQFSNWREAEADDFRDYLFMLMKADFKRATIRLRFAALRSFYKFLVLRRGLGRSPVAEVLLPKPEQRLSVQVLKRRGPVLADPITLDLPQPVAAIRLRARPAAEALAPRQSLHTIHARQDTRRPALPGASGTVLPEPLRA